MKPIASTGKTTATTAIARAATSTKSASPQARPSSVPCLSMLTHAVPRIRGSVTTIVNSENASIGTTTRTHTETTARAHGFSTVASGWRQRHGSRPSSVGRMRWNRSGTPVTSASTW